MIFFENENKHYITLFILAKCKDGEPKVMEPDKCEEWKWFEVNNLPKPLFLPLQNLITQKDLLKFKINDF